MSKKITFEGIGGRLAKARTARGYTSGADVARALTRSRIMTIQGEYYNQLENGTRNVTLKRAVQFATFYRVSLNWLTTGTGEMDDLDEEGITVVPFLTWVSAGDMLRDDAADEAIGSMRVADLPQGDWIALEVKGDSMDRISPPESRILVNRKDKELVPNACYVIDDGEGNATYKRYRPNPTRFEPVSTNPIHEPIYPDNDPTIVGRVRESILKL